MFTVEYQPRDKVLVRSYETKEEADNFKKNCRSLCIKVVGSDTKKEPNNTKIEWPRV